MIHNKNLDTLFEEMCFYSDSYKVGSLLNNNMHHLYEATQYQRNMNVWYLLSLC